MTVSQRVLSSVAGLATLAAVVSLPAQQAPGQNDAKSEPARPGMEPIWTVSKSTSGTLVAPKLADGTPGSDGRMTGGGASDADIAESAAENRFGGAPCMPWAE